MEPSSNSLSNTLSFAALGSSKGMSCRACTPFMGLADHLRILFKDRWIAVSAARMCQTQMRGRGPIARGPARVPVCAVG